MSQTDVGNSNDTALDSVRQIERTLEDRLEIEKAAEKRRATAREEAEQIIAIAREEGKRAAEKRRREVLADANEEAESILEAARAEAEKLRERATEGRDVAAQAVVEQILPGGQT